jgi:hypothetical protein
MFFEFAMMGLDQFELIAFLKHWFAVLLLGGVVCDADGVMVAFGQFFCSPHLGPSRHILLLWEQIDGPLFLWAF